MVSERRAVHEIPVRETAQNRGSWDLMAQRTSVDTELKGGAMRTDERKRMVPSEGYIRLPEVIHVFPVSASTWWAGISAGRFPKGVKLGPRITAWKVEDIRKLIESRN